MTGKALFEALDRCEALLAAETGGTISEAGLAQKEAAISQLEGQIAGLEGLDEAQLRALLPRLQALLASNRFSLKWNGLRFRLAQLGQPKAPIDTAPPRPRVDLVH